MTKKVENPFIITGYKGAPYFCDRQTESKLLKQLIVQSNNTTLFAIRRIGKTGLIHHVFQQVETSKRACIYVDVLSTENISDFTNQLVSAIYQRFPPQKPFGKKVMDLIKSFRPTISFDELNGMPNVSLTLETSQQKDTTIGKIFKFLDNQKLNVVFAIDEFQQILSYPEKNTEALLRSHIQGLKNVSFIFCGSNQQMMHEIFNSAKRPFYASCTNMSLDYIPDKAYRQFISQKFNEVNRSISEECLDFIIEWTTLHTYYTQQFCHALFALNKKSVGLAEAKEVALFILNTNENTFYQYRNLLTKGQWKLLEAIAKEERVRKPQSKSFIKKHDLGTPSVVKRGIDALLSKEVIFFHSGTESPYYEVYDKFLMRWIQSKST